MSRPKGVPRVVWRVAKVLHRLEAARTNREVGVDVPKFKHLPEWAMRAYLSEAREVIVRYEEIRDA